MCRPLWAPQGNFLPTSWVDRFCSETVHSIVTAKASFFLRRFRDPIRVPRIRENYHRVPKIRENRVPRIREIESLQIQTRFLTFSLKKTWPRLQTSTGATSIKWTTRQEPPWANCVMTHTPEAQRNRTRRNGHNSKEMSRETLRDWPGDRPRLYGNRPGQRA